MVWLAPGGNPSKVVNLKGIPALTEPRLPVHEAPTPIAPGPSAGSPPDPPRWSRRRRVGVMGGAILVAALVAASAYAVLSRPPGSFLPVAWDLPGRCYQYCGFATQNGTLFVLMSLNSPEGAVQDLASYFSLSAYSLVNGALLWIVSNFTLWGLWTQRLFVYGTTVAVVAFGDGEWVPGQQGPPFWNGSSESVLTLEWNATSGAFVNQTQYRTAIEGLFLWSLDESQGWIVAVGVPWGSNATVLTIPMRDHSTSYGEWNESVSIGTLPSGGCPPFFTAFLVNRTVSIWAAGAQNLTTVLKGSTGAELWQGRVAGWYASEEAYGCPPSTNVVPGPNQLYYVAGTGVYGSIDQFNPSTHTEETVASLRGTQVDGDELSYVPSGELILTESAQEVYRAYSVGGIELWNRSLPIVQVGGAYGDTAGGIVAQPILFESNSVLLYAVWSWASGASGTAVDIQVPFQSVNASTGAIVWQSTYQTSVCLGSCGSLPTSYTPLAGDGPFIVFSVYSAGATSCDVARFPG